MKLWMGTAMSQADNPRTSPTNIQALAALRPGMPVSRVQDAIGSAWRGLPPHKGGKVDILENSHGVVIHIDKNGRIGMVRYDHRFQQEIDGLRMGMSPAAAEAAMPDLKIGDDLAMMPGVRFGSRSFPDGTKLNVQFTLETITGINFVDPNAIYPEPTSPSYPAASGAPGAPFADVNFKLVALSYLLDAKIVDLGTPQQLAAYVLGRSVDLEEEGYEPIPKARDYLACYPLTDDLLAQVEGLVFDGGNEICRYIQYFWDGEDDYFDIHDISGIELCPNLASLNVISMTGAIDIRGSFESRVG